MNHRFSIRVRYLTWAILATAGGLIACQPSDKSVDSSDSKVLTVKTNRLQALDFSEPQAPKQPFSASYHGEIYQDEYHWLRDKDYPTVNDPAVLGYLNQENAYFEAFIKPNKTLKNTIFEEFKGRQEKTLESVPWTENGYEYRWYFAEGEDYRVWVRKDLKTGKESEFLNESSLAKDHDYFVLGDWDISRDNQWLAYSVDTSGDEKYSIVVVNLNTGKNAPDSLDNTSNNVIFSADSQSLVYAKLQSDRWFVEKIKVHRLGEPEDSDVTLFHEQDSSYFLGFGLTSDKKYIVISSGRGEAKEHHVIASDRLMIDKPTLMASRDKGFSYKVDHAHGEFYLLANDTHKNFRLAKVSDKNPEYSQWQTLLSGSDEHYWQSIKAFNSSLVLYGRKNGVEQLILQDYKGKQQSVSFPEPIYSVSFGRNAEFDQDFVRIGYSSMVTPRSVYDVSIANQQLTLKKQQEIPSGYDASQYVTERIWAPARDGKKIPVSIVYKKGFKKDASHPLFLYAYGAYGNSIDPTFSTRRLSLLDRGFSYAIAHIRGGDMLGYQWYLDGKMEKRTNTFNDFVDTAKHLIAENYVAKGNISISGRSAGGELMGAVVNQAPDLWRSVILGVPFVDVLNTMLDASLPLTPPEWTEWGNPIESKAAYDLLKSYSPYDNISAKEYPPMLVTGGLNDPRVTYWEPAKWTAKMRANKTDNNLMLMRINMGAGHFANSGRYGRLKDYAEEYVFTLLAHGIDR